MMKVALQALASAVVGILFFGLALFWPAGTFDYWQAWVFIAVFTATTIGPSIYLLLRRPDVMRRRLHAGPTAESRPAQKIASVGFSVMFISVLVVSALDHRFGWSPVPTTIVVVGQVLVAIGLSIAMLVVLQNSYAASNVTVESDQKLVSTGLYGFVRHPMYFGVLIMMLGAPLALGSYWGLVVLVLAPLVFALRILDEEKALMQELAGYPEYENDVRHRLVPYVW